MAMKFGERRGLRFIEDMPILPIAWQKKIVWLGLKLAQVWKHDEIWRYCEDPDRMLLKVSGLLATKAIIEVCDSPLNPDGELSMHALTLNHSIEEGFKICDPGRKPMPIDNEEALSELFSCASRAKLYTWKIVEEVDRK